MKKDSFKEEQKRLHDKLVDELWPKYERGEIIEISNRYCVLAEMSNGWIFGIEKPHVRTKFYIGESGFDFDEAVDTANAIRTKEECFKHENLEEYELWIEKMQTSNHDYILRKRSNCVADLIPWHYRDVEHGEKAELQPSDCEKIANAYREAYKLFDKKLDAYLKRYGMKHIRAETYWLDR